MEAWPMSTHPYIPLYVDDYDAATAHLTVEEDGVYSRLIRLAWRTPGCSLPNDPVWIARKIRVPAGDIDRILAPVLAEFFTSQRGRLIQRRLKREYDDISRKKTARKLAGKKGGEAKARKSHENPANNAIALPPHTRAFQNQNQNQNQIRVDGGGGASASEIETTDDWPEGKAQDHARLIVAEVASPRLDPMKSPGLVTTAGRLMAWKRDGASWEHDVLPVVASVCAKQRGPVSTWKFFDQAIARSMADNRAALEIPSAGEGRRATGPPMSLTDRIAAEHAESRRMALEMLAAENGPTN